jgi:outer membrane protein OmpA-like peptidoglycan-associated protein/tetratricopeptide (TPR) repeat protein
MKTLRNLVLLFAFFLTCSVYSAQGQSVLLSRADGHFNTFAYFKAVQIYERLYLSDTSDVYLKQQLAYSYEKLGVVGRAIYYYDELIRTGKFKNEDLFNYAELLLKNGQYEDAERFYKRYMEVEPTDLRAKLKLERIQGFASISLLSIADTISLWPHNTRFSEMAPMFRNNELVFVSARDSSSNNTYSYNNQPFLDIYEFETNRQGVERIVKMNNVNTRYHEGPLCFTNNGNSIWFTRNNQKYSRRDEEATNNLKIYTADWDGRRWNNEREFALNSDTYSVGHPAFSPDGKTMYFASDMPGSLGDTDLFRVSKIETVDEKGIRTYAWGEPENLGPKINTKGKEMFPFVDARGVLFFATDGLGGFGGLDMYVAFPQADTLNVMNLGRPMNSTYDDFGFIVSNDFSHGYFTSNRAGGVGDDDIYHFLVDMPEQTLQFVDERTGEPLRQALVRMIPSEDPPYEINANEAGEVILTTQYKQKYVYQIELEGWATFTDSIMPFELFRKDVPLRNYSVPRATQVTAKVVHGETGEIMSNADVVVRRVSSPDKKYTTDDKGEFSFFIAKPEKVQIVVAKEGYVDEFKSLDVLEMGKEIELPLAVEPIYEGKTIELENLYYDTNSAEIRVDAALILDQLLEVMNKNPRLVVELGSHTDSRASASYNLKLSQQRTQKAVEYLISKGIDSKRMVAKGYGETKLLNHCSDGVTCSEEEHQRNRRTEFKILTF